jgi:endonuclease YncB( thermonuclease family)/PKD repeat protein
MAALATASVGGTAAAKLDGTYRADTVPKLAFESTSSLLNADGEPLTDLSAVPVVAETTAENVDEDGNGDAVSYPSDADIPLAAADGSVFGIGAPFVNDGDADFESGNEEFLLNVWDDLVGGGTVLWDEGHDQFYDLSKFGNFEEYAESNDYDVVATSEFTADLDGANALVVTSPSVAFTDAELDALASFLDDGGALILHDQSDFDDFDETANLNAVASSLGLSFRFNDDQVVDAENNGGANFVPTTTRFDDSFPYFDDREGISTGPDLQPGERYVVDVVSVSDGDTVDVEFDDGTQESIRVLGVDTTEKASASGAERPQEWEGLSYQKSEGEDRSVSALEFVSGTNLIAADGSWYLDFESVPVTAPSGAQVVDVDGNDDAVSQPPNVKIPLAGVDGSVAAFGSLLVSNDDRTGDTTNFALNVWDDLTGGDATVAWYDNGQFDSFDKFSGFVDEAENAGYTVSKVESLDTDLSDVDLVVTSNPKQPGDAELDAIGSFVSDGGALFAMTKSDYNDFDNTAASNSLLEAVGAPFRFNDAQVQDADENFAFETTRFDTSFPYFGESEDGGSDVEYPYLVKWAKEATAFAEDELSGETVEIYFDENEGITDPFDRLLAYVDYDASGDGPRETTYNRKLIEEGLARVYGSTLSRHDEFWALENAARDANAKLWTESDISKAAEIRNRQVEELFFPDAAAVEGGSGAPVAAEDDTPLVGVDEDAGVAMVGSPFVDESYEAAEGFDVDTSGYENYAFLSNLLDSLSERGGDVLIDGGHGQFGADYALSSEDAAFYQRFLEGVGLNLEQVNSDYEDRLGDARALLVTTPVSAFTDDEVAALSAYVDDGGAVVLLGSAAAPDDATANLEALASDLGSDLRLGGAVTDGDSNLNGEASIPVTTNLDDSFDLFEPFAPEEGDDGDDGDDDPAQPTLSVSVDDERVGADGSTTATVRIDEAPEGVAGYRLEVGVTDPSVVEVTGGSYPDALGLTEDPVVADDGTAVVLKASDTEDAIEAGASDVELGTVDLAFAGAGRTELTATVAALDADGGAAIDPVVKTGEVKAAPVERIGDNPLPTDPDGDGEYEDLNGNGRLDAEDVVLLFQNKDSEAVTDNADAFDFNDNGRIDFDDINELFEEL